jgi:HlyD family secretion protein
MAIMRKHSAVAAAWCGLAGVLLLAGCRGEKAGGGPAALRTAAVERGDLVATIGATGTVQPEEVIDVGAQVAGRIRLFGRDVAGKPIDYGSQVEEGTVLAEIDDSLYAAEVASARALLQQAEANELSTAAQLLQSQARLTQAERDWNRAQKLGPSKSLSQAAFDQYESAHAVAKADVAVAEAACGQAQAQIIHAQANLQRAERNLGYCTIKSPVRGVIIDRRVNIGQTVVASLNAPSLFLLAKDLRRVQVWVPVNEADIGQIKPGMAAWFTVDAFPGETFEGKVGKVRLNATMTQNVVTYTVEVTTDNPEGRLLPYLTANVRFITGERKGVLSVPNAALRWQPPVERIAPGAQAAGRTGRKEEAEAGDGRARVGPAEAVVWVEDGKFVRPVKVEAGLSDGARTEVAAAELAEGRAVVVGTEQGDPAVEGGRNPFAPNMGRGRPAGGGGGGGGPR